MSLIASFFKSIMISVLSQSEHMERKKIHITNMQHNRRKILACKTLPKNEEENVHMEVEIMQHLSGHPNFVTLRSVYEDVESLHLVMEFFSGGCLIDSMSKNGCYLENQATNLIKQLVVVIKYYHEMRAIHWDIKPENILLTSNGSLKLADFGLSVHVANSQHLSGVVGSPAYFAPEVLAGTYSGKVDVWGAGVLLHALLIGSLPFWGESVEAIFEAIKHVQLDFQAEKWKSISGPTKDLLSRMLSRDVEKCLSPEEFLRHPLIMFYTELDVKLQARYQISSYLSKKALIVSNHQRYSTLRLFNIKSYKKLAKLLFIPHSSK